MRIFFKTWYSGVVEVTQAQKEALIKHITDQAIGLPAERKQAYIESKFSYSED